MASGRFKLLLSDIGGVLGTNGWDGNLRRKTCEHFAISHESIDSRHRLVFDSFERGYITFDNYLKRVFFAEPRTFDVADIRHFILSGSVPWVENIAFYKEFKRNNGLQLGLLSNEGEGITSYRIEQFQLREVADFMVISHFVHLRKPDPSIWQLALDVAGRKAEETVYVDDRPVFVEIARDLGLTSIHYRNLPDLQERFTDLGLQAD